MRLNTAYEMGNQLAADNVIKEIKPLVKDKIETAYNNVPQKTRNIYASWGGTPFLDNNYTVFGKVISGHHIVDKIQWIETGKNDRPVSDVKIISTKVIPKKN
jgi:peptidyl-prolyl cis-trans isomerase B (cyclophilin B)